MRLTLAALLTLLNPVSALAQPRARPIALHGVVLRAPTLVSPVPPSLMFLPSPPAPRPTPALPAPGPQAARALSASPLPAVAQAAVSAGLPASGPLSAVCESAAVLAGPRGTAAAPFYFDGARRPAAAANAVVASAAAGVREGSWDLRPAARSLPSRVAVGPRNFELQGAGPDTGGLLDDMAAVKDHDARHSHLLTTRRIDPREAESILRETFPAMRLEAVQAQVRRLPAVLKAHFEETLARHAHRVEERAGASVYAVTEGLSFWADFATPADPERRAASRVFMQDSSRSIVTQDPAYGLVRSLTQGLSAFSRVVDAAALSSSDRSALTRLAEDQGLKMSRFGRWLLLGSGASFHLTRSVLSAAQDLKRRDLEAQCDKVLAFLAAHGIDIDHDQHLAAAAYYRPHDQRLAFVMPSRADLNTFLHEGTHARFAGFEDRLGRWLRVRRLALPYEADGPGGAINGRGGYFNLLNELNSWRLGERFDGGKSDADILAVLRDSYGRQAGAEAAATFDRLWSEERVAGISVARLILRSVRALNALDETGVDDLGRRSLMSGDGGAQRDFLRLAGARHEAGTAWPGERKRLLARLAKRGADEGVRGAAERLLRPDEDGTPAPGSRSAARKARKVNDEAKMRGRADFSSRGFAALWAEFPKNPAYGLRKLLTEKHAAEFTPVHVAQLVRWALAAEGPEALRSGAQALLAGVFSARGLDTLYPEHQLKSMQGLQRAMNAHNGLPADAHMPRNRPQGLPDPLLSPEVDRALAEGMFDGKPGIHRLKVIELVTQRTYPEELPELRRRVASVITDNNAAKFDRWVAHMFLVPASSILFDAHARWGAAAARAALDAPTPNATALEFVGEHLRLGLGRALKGPSWGRYRSKLDAEARREALEAVSGYSPEDAADYRRALDDLWRLLNHPDRKVARSARYAVAARPVFFVGLEARFAAAPDTPGLTELMAMTEPGFAPALEPAAAAARAPLAPALAFASAAAPVARTSPPSVSRFRLRPAEARAALGQPHSVLLALFRSGMTRTGSLLRKHVGSLL